MSSNKNSVQNTQSTDFVNIQLLECNRRFSQEVQGGNETAEDSKARFTNRVQETRINIGDKISVANVFANQRGASSEVLQLDGTPVSTSHFQDYQAYDGYGDFGVEGSPSGRSFTKRIWFNQEYTPKDNSCYITINYYKNKNGENHISLPRSWAGSNYVVDKVTKEMYPDGDDGKISEDYRMWKEEPSVLSGLPKNFTDVFAGAGGGVTTNFYQPLQHLLKSDWRRVSYVVDNTGTIVKNKQVTAQAVDNSRYMLFAICDKNNRMIAADNMNGQTPVDYHNHNGFKSAVYYEYPAPTDEADYFNSRDPPTDFIYLPITEQVSMGVGKGYVAPVNIANSLSAQLSKTGDTIKQSKTISKGTATEHKTQISSRTETPTMKPFPCGSTSDWSQGYFTNNRNYATSDKEALKIKAMQYLSNYEIVGFKRPEIQLAIRNNSHNIGLFTPAGFQIHSPIKATDKADPLPIATGILWNSMNLLALKEVFDAQFLYKHELWDWDDNVFFDEADDGTRNNTNTKAFFKTYVNKKSERSRYINIQSTDNANQSDPSKLGCDMYQNTGNALDPVKAKDHVSQTLWIDYSDQDKDFFVDSYQQIRMCYGFATKYKHTDGSDYIYLWMNGELNNETNKYAPDYLWEQWNGQAEIPIGSRIGFDFHFSAFGHGNSIGLYSGLLDWYANSLNDGSPADNGANKVQIQCRGKWDSDGASGSVKATDLLRYTGNIRQTYIGANAPLINFDQQSSRFGISQLHSSEFIGNNESAGSNIKISPVQAVPDSINQVYKINKRSNFFNFCPDLVPYTMLFVRNDVSNTTDKVINMVISDVSPFLDKYFPYDSHTGISIADWGYNVVESSNRFRKNTWEESLWSKLGFLQDDLIYNNPDAFDDAIFNKKTNDLDPIVNKFPTTNAIIEMVDIPQFVKNGFGNSMHNYQLPTSTSLFGMDDVTPVSEPAVNIVQTSSVIQASLFPKKMENGFFLIRSNIIPNTQYSGSKYGGTELNVVAVCNKENAESDFFFSESSQMEFTATKPFVISEITTSIHKPNMELADLDQNSCVIYKVEKNIMQQTDLISDILSRQK